MGGVHCRWKRETVLTLLHSTVDVSDMSQAQPQLAGRVISAVVYHHSTDYIVHF